MSHPTFTRCLLGATAALALWTAGSGALAQTLLADKPVFASVSVAGNLALALSVEFPTAVSNAHLDTTYNPASTYLGYFDPDKCYDYKLSTTAIPTDHFAPVAKAATGHVCTKQWSGNFMNWATMQTIDPFRWALTGGQRYLDTTTATVLEKAWASGQGGTSNFPDRSMSNAQTTLNGATPLGWSSIKLRVQGMGNLLRFTRTGDNNSGGTTAFTPTATLNDNTSYTVMVRVRVCDASISTDLLEPRCKAYSNGTNYKPEGLIQQYADQIRFSAFGYLNDGNLNRDGGVLRARQKFVGPTQPVPGGDAVDNGLKEWSASTGIMTLNPDSADAAATATAFSTTISTSGVMNYLNNFGASHTYKTYDPVGELYYTALRYFRNLGNVPEYTSTTGGSASNKATWADGFPVISNWDDPIQYYCQKNFILGIGDVNTHADRNLPYANGASEPSKPAAVSNDTELDTVTWTNRVGTMSGLSNLASTSPYNGCCTNNGALMAGMAYWANSNDIRPASSGPDSKTLGMQTVQTYWLDVLENSTYKASNQYYLATKYGGAILPSDFNPVGRTADLPTTYWHTGPSTDTVGSQLRPDTYYTAARPDLMVSGLTSAFVSIASRMKALSSAFTNAAQSVEAGTANYASQFDAANWSGDVIASSLSLSGTTVATNETWRFAAKLGTQAAGTGWDTGRYIVTVNDTSRAAVPFRLARISSGQSTALTTTYRGGDSQEYLNYLRGDRSYEQSSGSGTTGKKYRDRVSLVGDIVNAKLVVVGPPSLNLSDVSNPGYGAYKAARANRPNVVIAGTNQGMVHVIDGSLTGSTAGREIFAYVPSALFNGPTNSPGVNGLQSLGNPNFNHYFMVDAPPVTMDVDFGNTVGGSGSDWRSIVVGGLGKGGKMIYALDVTDLSTVNSETVAATKVLWEFTEADMGYTFGQPLVTRTAAYGWVVLVPAGHNNATGKNHLYVLNARTGALIVRVDTPSGTGSGDDSGTAANPSGMTQLTAFYPDLTSLVAESVYGGDLRGSVWRFDLRSTPYPQGVKVALVNDQNLAVQPITTHVLPVIQPETGRRFMVFGTGKMLASNDINSTQLQRMYAIADGSAGKFNATADLPSSVSFPIGNDKLRQLTDVTQPVTIDYTQQMGWYLNVASGYRIVTDPTYFGGIVVFTATVPNNSNPCSPSGSSIVYALSLGSGQTQFTNNAIYFDPGFGVIDAQFIKTPNGPKLLISGSTPSTTCNGTLCLPPVNDPASIGNKLLNWREVPLRNAAGGIQ